MHGRTRLCGLTPVQAPPTSHQDHAALTRPRTCALHQTPSTRHFIQERCIPEPQRFRRHHRPGSETAVPQTPLAAQQALLRDQSRVCGLLPHGRNRLGRQIHPAHPGAVYIPAVTRLSGGHQTIPGCHIDYSYESL